MEGGRPFNTDSLSEMDPCPNTIISPVLSHIQVS